MNISFSTDAKDRITQECGICHQPFKVAQAAIEPLEFCPFCGARPVHDPEGGNQGFLTEAQYGFAAHKLTDKMLSAFDGVDGFEVSHDGFPPLMPVETEDDMPETTTSACCTYTITHEAAPKPQFCGACGKKLS